MADAILIPALKGKPKALNLCNKKLDKVPKIIGKLDCILHLQLRGNKLKTLPIELSHLFQLQILNLGNNEFEELPEALEYLTMLEKLHLFNNKLRILSPKVLTNLRNLTFLNLNSNNLKTFPPEICRLSSLQHLSVDYNQLTELPVEMCALLRLEEFHAANNQLTSLPLEFGFLVNLEKLHLQKNKIRELPESLGKCYKLRTLDIAANELRIFPTELSALPLKEMYCEENPLLQHIPVHSVQEEEVLSLKEINARYIMKELKDRWSYLRRAIRHYPQIKEMLAQASKCAVCGESFLNTWLECVCFVDAKEDLKLNNLSGLIPVRALLCSYRCFNSSGHDYYGVAFP
ncbi:leucine-rich repeat-containing protein 69-like [Saccostrea echinata]|uniref:leucine-rich repeat-containing protein 69-like n=1 Tax=Saccostrea echinata TaxID=191078 RepID=UPI002A82A6F1|nr:leucine-rich repeat-containing protein 69-like [Saccostrea echinata]